MASTSSCAAATKASCENCAALALPRFSCVMGIRVKWTVTGLCGVDILATMAWVSGSREVFEDGTIMPRRTGATAMTRDDKPVLCIRLM